MTTAIYVRVSTADQSCDMQKEECLRMAAFKGWEKTEIFEDHGISGVKKTRPALEKMLWDCRHGKFKRVLVWKLDRFGRNTAHLVTAVDELTNLGIDFVSMTESFDTSTSMGRACLTIMAACAQLERDNIAERTKAGLRAAKAAGTKLGRRKSCYIGEVVGLHREGWSPVMIAKELQVSVSTVKSRIREAKAIAKARAAAGVHIPITRAEYLAAGGGSGAKAEALARKVELDSRRLVYHTNTM